MDGFIKSSEAAHIIGYTPKAISKLCAKNRIPNTKQGKYYYIPEQLFIAVKKELVKTGSVKLNWVKLVEKISIEAKQ